MLLRSIVLGSILLGAAAAVPAAALFECVDADGHRTFSDQPCAGAPLTAEMPMAPLIGSQAPGEGELRQLEQLDRRLEALRKARLGALQRSRTRAAREHDARQRQCARLAGQLAALADERRHGYAASRAASLRARQASLRDALRADCR